MNAFHTAAAKDARLIEQRRDRCLIGHWHVVEEISSIKDVVPLPAEGCRRSMLCEQEEHAVE